MEENLKQLLLKDLCARLPYGVYVVDIENDKPISTAYIIYDIDIRFPFPKDCSSIKPYLRPMSSMTEEEGKEFSKFVDSVELDLSQFDNYLWLGNIEQIDWLNAHHFDYRGLIDKGLALKATEGMYK